MPGAPLPVADPRADWLRAPASGMRASWLGHSSVLLEIDGHRVLTDPVWGPRASPSTLVGPQRFQTLQLFIAGGGGNDGCTGHFRELQSKN